MKFIKSKSMNGGYGYNNDRKYWNIYDKIQTRYAIMLNIAY